MAQTGFFISFLLSATLVHVAHCKTSTKIDGAGRYEVEPGEFPFMAFILQKSTQEFITSGVLVAPNVVLTLALNYFELTDLYQRLEDISVVLGAHNRSADERTRQEFGAVEIIGHPDFFATGINNANFSGDLALIKLDGNARLNRRVKVFPSRNIARTSSQDDKIIGSDRCVVTGYGLIKYTLYEEIYPRTLQAFAVQVSKHSVCKIYFAGAGYTLAKQSWLCSQNDDLTETRPGDGGNPLLSTIKNGYRLHGLCSAGSDGRGEGYQRLGINLYSRISKYRSWILDTTNQMKAGQFMKKD